MADFGANMVLKATMDSKDFDQGMHRAQKRTKQFQDQTKQAQGQLRLMRGGLGQLGHQIQDVAVQLQMGQNAMLVFGQQGSQIASLMGPNGALIGAFLAIGAALATSLAPSLFGATEAMKLLNEASKELIDDFDNLTEAEKEYARSLSGKTQEEMTAIIKKLENANKDLIVTYIRAGLTVTKITETEEERAERLRETNQRLDTARKLLQKMKEKVDDTTDTFIKFNSNIAEQNIELIAGAQALQEYKIQLSNMNDEEKLAARIMLDTVFAIREQRKERKQQEREQGKLEQKQNQAQLAINKRFETERNQYTLQIASIGKTAQQTDRLRMISAGYGEQQILEIERLKQLKIARQEAYDAQVQEAASDMGIGETISAITSQFEELDSATKSSILSSTSTVFSSVSQTMDNISQLFEQGSAEAKAFMLVSKSLEASNAIIAGLTGEVSINAAYAKLALANPAMAPAYTSMGKIQGAMMKTMGFVNAGLIMGQAAASFDGGGFTGMGARTGGLDGKGGFPAILHPNETVIDHTKTQSMSTNVTINIQANDTKGFDELLRSRRGEIIGIVNKAINNRGVSSLI